MRQGLFISSGSAHVCQIVNLLRFVTMTACVYSYRLTFNLKISNVLQLYIMLYGIEPIYIMPWLK